uniref:Uncharacterized protein n=1 Tax=Oryza punctata TaxID=4537 RepID=A0A0E0L071_ORYPU
MLGMYLWMLQPLFCETSTTASMMTVTQKATTQNVMQCFGSSFTPPVPITPMARFATYSQIEEWNLLHIKRESNYTYVGIIVRLRQVMTQVRRNMFSWRVNGSMGKPQLCISLMSHLRRKKLRILAGMLSAGTIPAVIWILMPTKQMTTLSTTATAMARGVTSSLNSGNGCFSNTASTDVADMESLIIASMAIKAPGQWGQPPRGFQWVVFWVGSPRNNAWVGLNWKVARECSVAVEQK